MKNLPRQTKDNVVEVKGSLFVTITYLLTAPLQSNIVDSTAPNLFGRSIILIMYSYRPVLRDSTSGLPVLTLACFRNFPLNRT